MTSLDTFHSRSTLDVDGRSYEIFRLDAVDGLERLPYCLKVLAENLLRTEDGANVTADHVRALAAWDPAAEPDTEIQFTPARVIMQDFTGVPCIVDLATMREAVADLGGDPEVINPLAPAEMVIDHSVQIDSFGLASSLEINKERLAVFDRSTVFNQNFFNDTGFLGFDFVHQLHGFDDAQSIAGFDLLADFDESGGVRAGGAVERTDHRRFLRVGQIASGRGGGRSGCSRSSGRRGNRSCGRCRSSINGSCGGSGARNADFFFAFGNFNFCNA